MLLEFQLSSSFHLQRALQLLGNFGFSVFMRKAVKDDSSPLQNFTVATIKNLS